jgi:hypothetical protein
MLIVAACLALATASASGAAGRADRVADAGGHVHRAAAAVSGDAAAAIDGAFHGLAGVSVDRGIATPPGGEMHGLVRAGFPRSSPPRADGRLAAVSTPHVARRAPLRAASAADPTNQDGFHSFDASTGAASVLGALLVAVVVRALRRVAHARARRPLPREDIDELDETIYVFHIGQDDTTTSEGPPIRGLRALDESEFAHLRSAQTRSEPSR